MPPIIITLQTAGPKGTLDLELPDDVPLQNLLPELVRAVGLPAADRATGHAIDYSLELTSSSRPRVLRGHETLSRAGVVTGSALTLRPTTPGAGPQPGMDPLPPGSLRPVATLRGESGRVYGLDSLSKTELTVGRYDARTGQTPDVELSNEPAGETVSRAHALLRKQGPQWVLIPISTRSPSAVDGAGVVPQQVWPLQPGQTITLGQVKLVFEK